MYEIIDENLKLARCGINDLTLEQASCFLSQWEDGAKLRSLTLFFDPKGKYLVINRDNPEYEFNLEMARGYLCADARERETYRNKYGKRYEEIFRVMDNFMIYTRVQSELKIIGHQVPYASADRLEEIVLERLEDKQMPTCFLISQAYSFGVINGKRIERARRKGGAS